jgi:hypothetical protein
MRMIELRSTKTKPAIQLKDPKVIASWRPSSIKYATFTTSGQLLYLNSLHMLSKPTNLQKASRRISSLLSKRSNCK